MHNNAEHLGFWNLGRLSGFLRGFVVLLHVFSNIPGQYLAYATIASLQILFSSLMINPDFIYQSCNNNEDVEDDNNIQAHESKLSRNVKEYTRLNKITYLFTPWSRILLEKLTGL
jgi:hypothetical protein